MGKILRDSWQILLWSWMLNPPTSHLNFPKKNYCFSQHFIRCRSNCTSSGSPVRKNVAVYSRARDKKGKNGWCLSRCPAPQKAGETRCQKRSKCLVSKAWRIKEMAASPCCIAQHWPPCYAPMANKHIFIWDIKHRYTHKMFDYQVLSILEKREHLPLGKSVWTQSMFPLVPPWSCRLETGDVKKQSKIPTEPESLVDFHLLLRIPDLSMLFGIYLNELRTWHWDGKVL